MKSVAGISVSRYVSGCEVFSNGLLAMIFKIRLHGILYGRKQADFKRYIAGLQPSQIGLDLEMLISNFLSSCKKKHSEEDVMKEVRELLLSMGSEFNVDTSDERQAYNDATDRISKKIETALGRKPRVCYSAYDTDENDNPVDNLDVVAVPGMVKFIHSDNDMRYESPAIESPTWLHIACFADDMINTVGYEDHIFLEGVHPCKDSAGLEMYDDGVKVYKFSMGS